MIEPPLGFLGQLAWVDFRSQALDVGIAILAKAARGEEPGSDLQRHFDSVRASICLYRGLLYFREEDAPFFFGREVPIERLMDEVQRQPFVAVAGASFFALQPLVHIQAPGTRFPGSVSGTCVALPCFPRSLPLAPPTPPRYPRGRPLRYADCSPASSLLWKV
jgi:hypothetical protein